jgi:hypothetical protein
MLFAILWLSFGKIMLTYHINLDERGDFYADVRRNGHTIFEINGFDIFSDGWMKHKKDLLGLGEYLRHLDLIEPVEETEIEFAG